MSTEQELWAAKSLWEEVSKARPWLLELKGLLIPVLEIVVVAHNATVEARKDSGIKEPEAESGEVRGQKELCPACKSNRSYWHGEYGARLQDMNAVLAEAEIWVLHVTATESGETFEKANSTLRKIQSTLRHTFLDGNAAHTLTGEAEWDSGIKEA